MEECLSLIESHEQQSTLLQARERQEMLCLRCGTVHGDHVLPADHLLQRHHELGPLLPRLLLLPLTALGGKQLTWQQITIRYLTLNTMIGMFLTGMFCLQQ